VTQVSIVIVDIYYYVVTGVVRHGDIGDGGDEGVVSRPKLWQGEAST
jgi:hypothetical protein